MAKRLSNAKNELEKSRRELFELKYRIFFNKPPPSLDNIQKIIALSVDHSEQQAFHKYEKIVQRKKTDSMALTILGAEAKFYRCKKVFDTTLSEMWKNHRNLTRNQGMTTTLVNLLEKRFQNISNRWRDVYNYRLDNFFRNSYCDSDSKNANQSQEEPKRIGFTSSLIIDAIHPFTDKQLQLLNRGPSYVPPCQLLSSSLFQPADDLVKKQYALLKRQLNNLFSKCHINIALSMEIQQKIYDQYMKLFSFSIPEDLCRRAIYEKRLVQSIRYILNKNNLILRRTADNMNTFYVGNQQDFITKGNNVLNNNDAYKVALNKTNENNSLQWLTEFKEMIESFNFLLETLKQRKAINTDLFNRLAVDPTKIILPHADFLPDVSKVRYINKI